MFGSSCSAAAADMDVKSGMATMAMAMPTISFGHRSGHKWPKSDKSGHSWSFGHAYNTLTITCMAADS